MKDQRELWREPTWRHVKRRTATKVVRAGLLGSKTKVRELDNAIGDQDILRLEIPVIYANGMAKIDSVQYLKKRVFGHEIVSKVVAFFRDTGEQIAFWAELKYHKSAVI